jgi:hypothetical protein
MRRGTPQVLAAARTLFPPLERLQGRFGADGLQDPAGRVYEGPEAVPLIVDPGPLSEEVGEGHEGPLPGRGAWLEAEGPLLGVEGEGEEGLEALPVQDAGPHHLPGGEAQGEGQNPLPHLQDPGAPVGVDELQDLREGEDLQVAFHLNPSPSPRTSIRPSPR